MKILKLLIIFITRPALELTKDDNWMLSSFFGFFFAAMSFIVMAEYSNIWGRLLLFFFAYLGGICLGATAIIIERIVDED